MKRMRRPFVVMLCAALAVILLFAVLREISVRKRFREEFSVYESACTELSDYILDITPDGENREYYPESTDIGYVLANRTEDGKAGTELPPELQAYVGDLEQAFYKATHRHGPEWISVSGGSVIYYEMSYGGSLIYSPGGRLDKDIKAQVVTQRYHRLVRLGENWYAVRVRLL